MFHDPHERIREEISTMHRLDNMVVIDNHDDENIEFYSQGDYVKNMFDRVFENLNDKDGNSLKNKVKYKQSYLNTIEKCTIENSMELIYKLLNTYLSSQDSTYFRDNEESMLSADVLKVLEFMRHLHDKKVPKRFVGGFLVLMTKFVYFTS